MLTPYWFSDKTTVYIIAVILLGMIVGIISIIVGVLGIMVDIIGMYHSRYNTYSSRYSIVGMIAITVLQ